MTQEFPKAIYHPDSKAMRVVYNAVHEAETWAEWGIHKADEAEEGADESAHAVNANAATEINETNV